MKKSKRNKKVVSRENFPPTYPFMRLDPMAERKTHLLSFKQFIDEAWSPLIPSGPNAPKSQYSKLPPVAIKKPRETKLGTYGKAINNTPVDPVKVNLGMEAEKKRNAERNAARLKAAGGLGRLFTKEDTTLKTREDQYKSHQRKLDKETNRFLVRTGQDAEKMGLSKKGVRKVLTKFSQERDMENHDAPKSDSPRVNRIHKWGRKTASKANAFRAQHHDQVKKMLRVPGYGQ